MKSVLPFVPLDRQAAADVMKKSGRTLENWCRDGVMPAPVSLGGGHYWHPDVFYAWLDAVLRSEPWDNESLLTSTGPIAPFLPITIQEAATVMGKSVRRLEQWCDEEIMPPPVKIGGSRYWHPAVFYEWLSQQLKGIPTDEVSQPAESPPSPQKPVEVVEQPSRAGPVKKPRVSAEDRRARSTARSRTAALLKELNSP